MKRISPLLLLALNGCFACGTGSRTEEVDPRLKVYQPVVPPLEDRHTSSRLDAVAPGSWIRYQIAKDGGETPFLYGAVRVEEKSLWIEVVEESDPKKVSLRRVSFEGEVLSARYQEIPASGGPSEVADQPVSQGGEAVHDRPASVKDEKRKLTIGGKTIDAMVVTKVYRDDSIGREYEEEEAWSKDVPGLLENKEIDGENAGLVYRKSPTGSIKAVEWGSGYSPLIK